MEKRKAEGTFDLKRHIAVGRARTEHRFAAFYHLSRNRQDAFKAFLELCREHHIQLVIFLTPLHSEALQHLAKNTEYLARQQELETFLHSLTSVYEFPILNFTDIQHFKGVSKDFKDYVHYLKLNGQRIIDEITKHISLKGF